MPNFGVRAGYVWRGVRNQYGRVNLSIPYSAFTVPVSVRDPGPDGRAGTADDGGTIAAFDLAQEFRGRAPVNQTVNLDDSDDDFHNFEITGTKRMSNRWSLLASYGYTKSIENTNGFQGHSFRSNGSVLNPNDLIGTEDGRFVYSRSSVKLNGTWNSPWWDISFSPLVRYQQGVPYARTFSTTALSYGSVRFIAEPLGERRQDAIFITDLRVEKSHRFSGRDISLFFDLYNMFNENPAQNVQSSSGTAFLRPLSIVPPRLARIGVKLNF